MHFLQDAFVTLYGTELPWVFVNVACAIYVVARAIGARVSLRFLLLWLVMALLLPKITALLLFLFAGRKHTQLAATKRRINVAAAQLGAPIEADGNTVRMLGDRNGSDTWACLRAEIAAATTRIHIETYMLSPDAVGRELVRLLARRAHEGVQVRLLIDAVGSFGMSTRLCRPLVRAGGEVQRFNPVLPMQGKGSANWRNHRKLAVFDGRVAVVGGQNLGADYLGDMPSPQRLRDCSFRIEGPAVAGVERVFVADWCQADDVDPTSFADALRTVSPAVGSAHVDVISSGPDSDGDPVWDTVMRLLAGAQRSVTMVTPYFIPDDALLAQLLLVVRAGRRVRVVVPRRSDHALADFGRRWSLRKLHEAGAQVLFFNPTFLHAKLLVVDDNTALVGSANLDMRSLFLNYELGLVVRDDAALADIGAFIAAIERESTPWSEVRFAARHTTVGRAVEAVARVLAPLL